MLSVTNYQDVRERFISSNFHGHGIAVVPYYAMPKDHIQYIIFAPRKSRLKVLILISVVACVVYTPSFGNNGI